MHRRQGRQLHRGLPRYCIHPAPDEPGFAEAEQLYIDPEECIDCDACVEACPVDAITSEDQVPPEWQPYIAKNADYYGAGDRDYRAHRARGPERLRDRGPDLPLARSVVD